MDDPAQRLDFDWASLAPESLIDISISVLLVSIAIYTRKVSVLLALGLYLHQKPFKRTPKAETGSIKVPASNQTDTIHGTDIRIARILVYPIKSCAGIDLDSCDYDREGFEFDRKWMIVDLEKNKQLSARDNRGIKLVRVFPSIDRKAGLLRVSFPDDPSAPSFSVPLNPSPETLADWEIHTGFDLFGSAEGYVVQSDDDTLESPSEILSAFVGKPVLLLMNTPTPRPIESFVQASIAPEKLDYSDNVTVRFPDFLPILLSSEASLQDAEEKVHAMAGQTLEGCKPEDGVDRTSDWVGPNAKSLLVERFRPNIIVSGVDTPFGEDDWQEMEIEGRDERFLLPIRCPRCMFPNVDTITGKRDSAMPNNALMQYRKVEKIMPTKYCFGMYVVPRATQGILSVGDRIVVTKSAVNPTSLD
ncbi:hypothetical protein C8J56DRAFT_830290 [Mycena floridula]|nr:hypothetical protein C8J56DRAFT_830290 [Mycena floridula]